MVAQSDTYDVVVIGAGAAGLMAAAHAAQRGRRAVLLEKNPRPGVKILMSGGTRCNITHNTDERGIVAAYGPQGKFLHSALAALTVKHTVALFNEEGVATKIEDTGKVFPQSNKARDVLDALVRRLHRCGAELSLSEPVHAVERDGDGFRVRTGRRTLQTGKVVVTTGGLSYPGAGTTGDGYGIARAFGHTIVPTVPALVPITTDAAWVAELRGLTLPDAGVRVVNGVGGKPLASKRGSLLFAHFGLTGPTALDASRAVALHAEPRKLSVELDLMPHTDEPACDEWLKRLTADAGRQLLAVAMSADLPRRLCDCALERAGVPADRRGFSLTKVERANLRTALKRLSVPVSGTLGYEKAEVTAGGVSLDEVDSRTMQSKLAPGLYFAGEVLDLDGPIGGYNFQAAWSTGHLAGRSV